MATEDIDYYGLLGLEQTATLQEIKTAYRKKSLKVHPDRNPDNPEAARLFHELRVAADLLADPTQRASFDSLLNARNARKLRFSALDNKRKAMAQDLEQREKDFKRQKGEEDIAARQKQSELERLKEEGRKLRETREKEQQAQKVGESKARKEKERERKELERRMQNQRDGIVELGPLDKTLKIKWLKSLHPNLASEDAITRYLETLLHPSKPDIESIVVSSKTLANPSKGKYGSGVIAFKTLSAAVRLVKGKRKAGEGTSDWKGFEVDWAAGSPPAVLKDEEGVESMSAKPPRPPSPVQVPPSVPSFPAASLIDSDESTILARLREREREKLIEEMRRQDEEEELVGSKS
ncbi:J domain-containing protein [Sporobolomyces salmoneus]|uniref:J domain-containing protein n=1 Tax=Sporobolomyces salmoneus TaxID=183962 RepID=UPI00317F4471